MFTFFELWKQTYYVHLPPVTMSTRLTDQDQQYFPPMTDPVVANDVAELPYLSFVSEIHRLPYSDLIGCSIPEEGESPGVGINR